MLEEVKNYLSITWNDEKTDENLVEMIKEGEDYLKRVISSSLTFKAIKPSEYEEPKEMDYEIKSLLKDYVRYARNYSLEEFETNFGSKIRGVQKKYATSKQESSDV